MDPDLLRTWIAADLADLRTARIPFGRFRGALLADLPAEYLGWFERTGWPQGRLGELMRIVYQTKTDGAEEIFDALREMPRRSGLPRPPTPRS